MEKQNEQTKEEVLISSGNDVDVADMMKAGVHFGRKRSATNPKMKQYSFTVRNDIHVIDLDKTKEKLSIASDFLKNIVKNNGVVLFVGTRPQLKNLVKEAAISCQMPYATERWLGGTLTNWKEISGRLNYFLDLESKKNSGGLDKYTKHEQLKFSQEIERMSIVFDGLRTLKKIPEVVFVADAATNTATLLEAKKLGIPAVAIADMNANPDLINYLIPANSDGISSVKFILDKISKAISEVKKVGAK